MLQFHNQCFVCFCICWSIIGSCKVVHSQANCNMQGLLPDSSAIYRNVTCMGLLVQCSKSAFQPPWLASVSFISIVWRKANTGRNFLQLLNGFSNVFIMWTQVVLTMLPGGHVFQYSHQLLLKYLFYQFLHLYFSGCEIKIKSKYNLFCKTGYIFHIYDQA